MTITRAAPGEMLLLKKTLILMAFVGLAAGCGKDRSQSRGAALYAQQCAICHGGDKRGGGGAGVEGLSGTPSDLTVLARNAGGEFPRARVLDLLDNYAQGQQPGRYMRPFIHLETPDTARVKTLDGRRRVPQAQADLLAYLEAVQRP